MKELKELRQFLHSHPELSGQEAGTRRIIEEQMMGFQPDEKITLGSGGIAFLFRGDRDGPLSVFRAELDALPIEEKSQRAYISRSPGVSHVCGHDGHMAILVGLAEKMARKRPLFGNTLLLFQAAEETGQGAERVLMHPAFSALSPDYIFALHNIPGAAMHSILVREGIFSAASAGMKVRIEGKTSHAAEPEMGINPDLAVARIIEKVHEINTQDIQKQHRTFATVIQIQLGEEAYGTSPGHAELSLTLRSMDPGAMEKLKLILIQEIQDICLAHKLRNSIQFLEEFPAIINDSVCIGMVRDAAGSCKLPLTNLKEAYRWSEDFGYFTENIAGAYFGVGAGENQPALHNPDYDFPDDLIETGVNMFFSLYAQIHF